MNFINPWGLLSLISVPALIALYILRQKHKEVRVPGLYLWQKTVTMTEASTPWQKLKKNLLFLLQLLLVLLICLAISRPCISSSKVYDEITVIIDSSASMRAVESGSSRFEKAVRQAESMASGLASGKTMSVILASDGVTPLVSHSTSPTEIKKALSGAECGWAGADTESALLLAESMKTDGAASLIMIITDCDITLEGDSSGVEYINVAEGCDNAAVISASCGAGDTSYTVLSVIKNSGGARTLSLELICDGVLADAQKTEIGEGEAKSVYWKNIDLKYTSATVRITDEDILGCDNELCVPLEKKETKKVLLVSDSGFFFEKVFSALSGYEIYKSAVADYTGTSENSYDLYIFDSFVPDTLPETGAVWLFAPDKSVSGLNLLGTVKGTTLSSARGEAAEEICGYLNLPEISVSRLCEIEADATWETAAYCGMLPAIAVKIGDAGNRTVCVAFDIHDSNLPLLKEFPILIQNMLTYSLPTMTGGSGIYVTGSAPEIRTLAYSVSIEITDPLGDTKKLAPPFPAEQYTLEVPGVYTVTQTLESSSGDGGAEKAVGLIVARIPEEESEMAGSGIISGEKTENKGAYRGQTELWPYILGLVLLLMTAEWWVYYREY